MGHSRPYQVREEAASSGRPVLPAVLPALLRGWWLIAAGGLVGAVAVFLVVSAMPRAYTAEALLALETQRVAIPELQGVLGGEGLGDPMPLVRSEVQALRSRTLLREAAEAAGLPTLPAIAAEAAAVGWADAVSDRLSVFNDNRSLVIALGFTAPDAAMAARFINALVDRYLLEKSSARTVANRAGYDALSARAAEVRVEVETLERQLAETRAREEMVTTRAGSVPQQQLEDLSAALARATAERAEAVAAWERARSGGPAGEISDVVASATIARLREQEADASRRAAEAANRYGPNHPDRRAAAAQLSAVRGQTGGEIGRIVASLRSRADAATARERALSERLARAGTEAAGIGARQSDLRRLEREAEARRGVLQTLVARVEQTGVEARAAPPPGMRVLSRAEPPTRASGPKRGLATVFGAIAGLALGALAALLLGLRGRNVALRRAGPPVPPMDEEALDAAPRYAVLGRSEPGPPSAPAWPAEEAPPAWPAPDALPSYAYEAPPSPPAPPAALRQDGPAAAPRIQGGEGAGGPPPAPGPGLVRFGARHPSGAGMTTR